MKETQYTKILKALRKAGNKGCTVRDLLQFTNYPSARIHEMTSRSGAVKPWRGGSVDYEGFWNEYVTRHERQHNGRTIRVYVLKRVK